MAWSTFPKLLRAETNFTLSSPRQSLCKNHSWRWRKWLHKYKTVMENVIISLLGHGSQKLQQEQRSGGLARIWLLEGWLVCRMWSGSFLIISCYFGFLDLISENSWSYPLGLDLGADQSKLPYFGRHLILDPGNSCFTFVCNLGYHIKSTELSQLFQHHAEL